MDDYLKAFRSICLRVSDVRRAGWAALDLACLAAGRVDGFWEIGLKAWNIQPARSLSRRPAAGPAISMARTITCLTQRRRRRASGLPVSAGAGAEAAGSRT